MIRLDKNKVILLYKLIIDQRGGSAGVRDMALLDSAIEAAYQSFDGIDLYPSIEEKAARLGYGLISNHAFIDGNKRIGVLVMLAFLELNNVKIKITDEDLIKVGFSVANSTMGYKELLNWINSNKVASEEKEKE